MSRATLMKFGRGFSPSSASPVVLGWLVLQNKNKVQATFILCLYSASSPLTEVVEQALIFSCVTWNTPFSRKQHASLVACINKQLARDLACKRQSLI